MGPATDDQGALKSITDVSGTVGSSTASIGHGDYAPPDGRPRVRVGTRRRGWAIRAGGARAVEPRRAAGQHRGYAGRLD